MPANYCNIADVIVDTLGHPSGAGRAVMITPSASPMFIDGTLWNRVASGYVLVTVANNGTWSVNLPYPAICDPSSLTFEIELPDGSAWNGTVPSAAGPFTLRDLKVTYSWTYSAS